MPSAHQNFISRMSRDTKNLLDLYGNLSEQNVLWAGTPGYQTTITQSEIDSVDSFAGAGLTTQQLADVAYAEEQIRTILTNALPSMTVLANLP